MHLFRSIRRAALAAAVTGIAIGAVPAIASAASTCQFNPGTAELNVQDDSGPLPLKLAVSNKLLAISDGVGRPLTFCGGGGNIANVGNTDTINIFGPITTPTDGYRIDLAGGPFTPGLTLESDGNSEVEIVAFTAGGVPATVTVDGAREPENMRVGLGGAVDLGNDIDTDPDIGVTAGANNVRLLGNGGDDVLSGQGFGTGNATMPLLLHGGDDADRLEGGSGRDTFFGADGNDVMHAIDISAGDTLLGGAGFDTASADSRDVFEDFVEDKFVLSVGRLRLAPRVLNAEAGRTARLKMSWKHPKAWRQLRKLEVSLHQGKKAVGKINARPASGRLSGTGAVDLMRGSKLSHHGKWVTAKLAMRLPKSLAGQNLRVDVQAADKQGHKQLERDAGVIRVAN